MSELHYNSLTAIGPTHRIEGLIQHLKHEDSGGSYHLHFSRISEAGWGATFGIGTEPPTTSELSKGCSCVRFDLVTNWGAGIDAIVTLSREYSDLIFTYDVCAPLGLYVDWNDASFVVWGGMALVRTDRSSVQRFERFGHDEDGDDLGDRSWRGDEHDDDYQDRWWRGDGEEDG